MIPWQPTFRCFDPNPNLERVAEVGRHCECDGLHFGFA